MKSVGGGGNAPTKRRWRGLVLGVLGLVLLSMLVPLVFLLGFHNGFQSPGNLSTSLSLSLLSLSSFSSVVPNLNFRGLDLFLLPQSWRFLCLLFSRFGSDRRFRFLEIPDLSLLCFDDSTA